jgi:hypothetical protein
MKNPKDTQTEDMWMGIDLAAKPDETIYYIDDGPFDRNKDSDEQLTEWLWSSVNKRFEVYLGGTKYHSQDNCIWTKIEENK